MGGILESGIIDAIDNVTVDVALYLEQEIVPPYDLLGGSKIAVDLTTEHLRGNAPVSLLGLKEDLEKAVSLRNKYTEWVQSAGCALGNPQDRVMDAQTNFLKSKNDLLKRVAYELERVKEYLPQAA